jgi:Cytochrome c3
MSVRWWRRGGGAGWGWNALVPLLVVCLAGVAAGVRKGVDNVHRPDADCLECHTVDRATLESDHAAARAQLAPDLESRCSICHDEGPSHHTGIKPVKPVPAILPLSAEGLITCATCHFMHGEPNAVGDALRIDNDRGALCLTCHTLSELQ